MKKVGLIMLAILVMVGFGVQSSHAGVICFDAVNSCNDLKLFISPDRGGNIREVHGHEYGCGLDDRGFSGSMKITPTSKHYTLTGQISNGSALVAWYINIDKVTKTGPGSFSMHNDAYTSGAANFSIVPCPVGGSALEAAEITEPDMLKP
jgi:hypothetical protein